MPALEPLVVQILMDTIDRWSVKSNTQRGAGLWLLALSGLLGVVSVVYAAIALHTYLLENYMPMTAALLTCLVCLGLAVISLTARDLLRRRSIKKQTEATPDIKNALLSALSSITQELEEPVAENPRTSIVLAGITGYMTGNRLH